MPEVMTGRQRRFMGAQSSKKTGKWDVDMTAEEIKEYMKKHAKGKGKS